MFGTNLRLQKKLINGESKKIKYCKKNSYRNWIGISKLDSWKYLPPLPRESFRVVIV